MKKTRLALAATAAVLALGSVALAAPAMAAPGDDIVVNGNFDAAGYDSNGGMWLLGENFDGWVVTEGRNVDHGGAMGMRIYYPGVGEPAESYGAPYDSGPWAVLTGSITQTLPTEVGKTYRVGLTLRVGGWNPDGGSVGWSGGNVATALIDGVEAGSFATQTTEALHEFVFTATSTATELTFWNPNGAVGIDSVSVIEVPTDDSPIAGVAIAGGLGVAAVGAGGTLFFARRGKREAAAE